MVSVRQSLILTTLLSSLLLAGCSTPVKKIEISAQPIEKPPLTLPDTSKVKARTVKWKIVTKDNVNEIIADLEKKGDNVVLFSLTDKGYEALSLNTADLRKLIMEQQAIIAAYKQYYENAQSAIDQANSEIDSVKQQAEDATKPEDKKSWWKLGD